MAYVKTRLVEKEKKMGKDVKIIIILLVFIIILYSGSIIFFMNQISLLKIQLNSQLNSTKNELDEKINTNNADIQSKISQLTDNLMKTQTDIGSLGTQISSIKAKTSSDFSGIIEKAINSVVSIKTNAAQGTGFIISPDGYVITNAHVLSRARYADAITSNQEIRPMDLIGYNLTLDIALLKIDGDYEYLGLGDSNNVRVGEKVIAIGNPLGLSFSVSEGIVSGVEREGSNNLPYYIQTDAALNPGNSGGPLIGTDGEVIGINNFKIAGGENIGFALESNYIKQGINEIAMNELNETVLR